MNFYYLPKEYQQTHEMCYELIGQVEEFLVRDEYKFLQITTYPIDAAEIPNIKKEDFNVWDYLREHNQAGFRLQLNKSIILGLLKDFCYFMQESLDCSNKMRLVVTYALLRRPLVDNLKILLRFVYDDNFYDDFIKRNDYDPAHLNDDTLREYLDKTDSIRIANSIKGSFIYECIYKKENIGSILNLSNRAIHPVTTRPWNKTGEMNFNFMFATHFDIEHLWQHYYTYLPAILLFYVELFNNTIFCLFESEIDKDLYLKKIEKIVDIMQKKSSKAQ